MSAPGAGFGGLALVALLCVSCGSDGTAPTTAAGGRDATGTADTADRPIPDTGTADVRDAIADSGEPDTSDEDSLSFDAVITDAFVRPEAGPRDTTETDATDDSDTNDGTNDDALDAADGEVSGPDRVLSGTYDCLRYEIRVSDTRFNLKLDDIRVTYFVQNVCATPYQVRVEHFSDFFAIGIHRNGDPWIFLPDCPGTGEAHDYTFTPRGGGVNRGWIWNATDHEARMDRCGVTFDDTATYSIVGYGATEIDLLDTTSWSEVFVMTDPIEIELRL